MGILFVKKRWKMKRKLPKKANNLLLKILEIKGEPITLIYYAITKIAEEYNLSYGEVNSILMNFRADCMEKATKEKFKRIIDWEIVEEYLNKDKGKFVKEK